DENVSRMAVRLRFVHQALSLQDAETMLLVDCDESKTRKLHFIFDQRMRTDHKLCLSGTDAFESGGLLRRFHSADEQLNPIAAGTENAPRRQEMLHGKNFRGRHQRRLAAVFDGD